MVTRTGIALIASAVVWTSLGLLTRYPELLGVGCVCALLVVGAIPWLGRLPRFDVEIRIDRPYVPLETRAEATLTLRNQAGDAALPAFDTAILAGDQVLPPFRIRPVKAADSPRPITVPLRTECRGRYVIGPVRIVQADPLRVFVRQAEYGNSEILHVYPRILSVRPLPTSSSDDEDGEVSAHAPRGGVTFKEVRPYVPGDDSRLIHWKSSARYGELMVRQNVVLDRPPHVVVLETNIASYVREGFEEAVCIAASLSIAAARLGFPVEIRTTGGERATTVRGRGGLVDASPVLRLLSGVRQRPDADDPASTIAAMRAAAVTGIVAGRLTAGELRGLSAALRTSRFATVICVTHVPEPTGGRLFGQYVSVGSADEFADRWNVLARR